MPISQTRAEAGPRGGASVPRATYRLQFHSGFRFQDAMRIAPYLRDLGVTHIYASPLLAARAGSTHGYDVCDFSRINPELGAESDLADFAQLLREHGIGLVLDIVPNHMGIGGPGNLWWWDVLRRGPGSAFAQYFDIDWDSPEPGLRGKVLVPVLGDEYDRALERGELKLTFDRNTFTVRYFDHTFPVSPTSESRLFESAAEVCSRRRKEAEVLIAAEARLLPPEATDLREGIDSVMNKINSSSPALRALIEEQHYRLACWRRGDAELNYRRFFNVTTLAGLRVEDERVFRDTHGRVLDWYQRGFISGLRVDHPDGLRDPARYLERLREAAPGAWIVVEKILEPGEELPEDWPVDGTTGYDFTNLVNGLFVDRAGEKPLTDFYAGFTGEPADYRAILHEKKRLVLRELLAAEVTRLTRLLIQMQARAQPVRDFSEAEWREALIELAANFPVYRTYIRAEPFEISETDAAFIQKAITAARQNRPDLPRELFDALTDLLLRSGASAEPHTRALKNDFIMRFQQLTGPAMAKGAEDTAFYCYNRLVSLNEVGGDPGQFGIDPESFHDACRRQQVRWPNSMLATSTHDTKRSEDVRARINLLSEMPVAWRETVLRWSAMNGKHRRNGWPDHNSEYLYYQTLVGAWPLSVERAQAYMEKASCEAKQHTDWTRRNATYETALRDFVARTLQDPEFKSDLEQFLTPLVEAGRVNSLAQTLVKLTAPGVPDIYQGTELWDLSLVDPDNRRPVDFEVRRGLLEDAATLSAEEAWRRREEGLPKLWLIRKTLAARAQRPEWFAGTSAYEPLIARAVRKPGTRSPLCAEVRPSPLFPDSCSG